jgi:hypothetical protein
VNATTALPFGKHKGIPLDGVPTDYLAWALRECKLSTGLHAAVAGEVARRGGAVPPPPPPPRLRCPDCRSASEPRFTWQQDRRGDKRIRAECGACQKFIAFAPLREPYTLAADALASSRPAVDALLLAEQEGIELASDEASVRFATVQGYHAASQRLRDLLVRQANHVLGSMMGRQSP